MKRREFIGLVGSATVTWPIAARAQQRARVPRIGVLMSAAEDDPEGKARIAAFRQGLQKLGWADGQNAPSLGVELIPVNIRDAGEIERAVSAFARSSNGGLIVTAAPLALVHRDLIVALAARYKLCAVYGLRPFVTAGGLTFYGPDIPDQYRRASGYIDRILKGEKPADLPVQAPTKFEMAINIRTAKALGITVPPSVLARANEVIE